MRYLYRLILVMLLASLSASIHSQDDDVDDVLVQALSGRDYYVEVSVTNPEPYIGEQILYILRYYAFYLPSDPFPYELPDFTGFWLGNILESSDTRIQTIGNRQFFVGEAVVEITPLTAGQIEIDPAVFEVGATVFREGARLESQRLQINARSLPATAPTTFDGAVGQFSVSITHAPDEIILGQPTVLMLTVDGTGNLELLPTPDLPEVAGWRIYASPPRYNTVNVAGLPFGQKIFEWSLLPERIGTVSYPGFEFTYFDPQVGNYRTIDLPATTLNVLPGADEQQVLSEIASFDVDDTQFLTLNPISTLALNTETDDHEGIIFVLLWLLAPVIMIVIGAWHIDQQQRKRRYAQRRKMNALHRALDRLQSITNSQTHKASYQIISLLRAYIGDKRNLSAEEVKSINLMLILDTMMPTSVEKHRFQQLLDAVDALRYLPVESDYDLNALKKQIRDGLQLLESAFSENVLEEQALT